MEFRLEGITDCWQVDNLTREAFWNVYRPGCNEHLVIHKLRHAKSFIKELDYIAMENNVIIANIVYSKMFYGENRSMCNDVISFGPISVHPDYQKKGIGKKLISYTMEKAGTLGFKAVMITGNTKYYHPLGFVSASKYGIFLPGMPEQEEAPFFMVKEIEKGYFMNHSGLYDFDKCFQVNEGELEDFEKNFPVKVKREAKENDLKD